MWVTLLFFLTQRLKAAQMSYAYFSLEISLIQVKHIKKYWTKLIVT